MARTILHIDMDAFYCAVEERRDPSLRGAAFSVGGPSSRSVVASCSYPARARGVRTGMPTSQARRLCPELQVIQGDYEDFVYTSRQILYILADYAAQLEPLSVDEAWLQIDGDARDGQAVAQELRRRINRELRLPCSIGISTSKLVAKIATDVGKKRKARYFPLRYPNTLEVVPPGGEADYLAPLPISVIWGVGPRTEARLNEMAIQTIAELRRLSRWELQGLFGVRGLELWDKARAIDDQELITEPPVPKSVSHSFTFPYDLRAEEDLRDELRGQTERVIRRLRRGRLVGRVVYLSLRWSDFTTSRRQRRLGAFFDDFATFDQMANTLFDEIWQPGRAVRRLRVAITGCVLKNPPPPPGSLWEYQERVQERRKQERLDATLRELEARFGAGIVWRADPGPAPRRQRLNLRPSILPPMTPYRWREARRAQQRQRKMSQG